MHQASRLRGNDKVFILTKRNSHFFSLSDLFVQGFRRFDLYYDAADTFEDFDSIRQTFNKGNLFFRQSLIRRNSKTVTICFL